MAYFRKNSITLRQIWPLVAYGDPNIDLSEKMTEVLSKVLIETNQKLFRTPFYLS